MYVNFNSDLVLTDVEVESWHRRSLNKNIHAWRQIDSAVKSTSWMKHSNIIIFVLSTFFLHQVTSHYKEKNSASPPPGRSWRSSADKILGGVKDLAITHPEKILRGVKYLCHHPPHEHHHTHHHTTAAIYQFHIINLKSPDWTHPLTRVHIDNHCNYIVPSHTSVYQDSKPR